MADKGTQMHIWRTIAISNLGSRPECVRHVYIGQNDTWGNWACPYFEKPEIERIPVRSSELDNSLVHDAAADAFTTTYDPDAPSRITHRYRH